MKALMLVGAMTYVSPATDSTIIREGETVVVAPKYVAHMLNQSQTDMTNVERPLFKEVDVEAPTYDFVNKPKIDVVDPALLAKLDAAKSTAATSDEVGDDNGTEGDTGETGDKPTTTQRVARATANKK